MKALRTWSIRALARQQHLPGRQRPWLRERRSYSALLQSTQKASSFGYGAVGILIGTTSATAAGLRDWFGETGAQSSPERQSVVPTSQRYADVKTTMRAVEAIRQALGDEAVSLDEEDLETHGYSEWSTSNIPARPVAVITPSCTEDVCKIATICTKYKVPMIPFGAGSSVEGNFTAPFSGLSIDMSKMNRVIEFHEADMDVVVQPGVNWVELNESMKSSGLFLPVDPSPSAHIGGMVATNCSGTNAMKYGTMKDWVVNLTVVLADGSVIKTRRRPRKSSAGYNLNALFTGSEGTLGIITEITLKLATLPTHFGVATVTFPTVKDAAAAASSMIWRNVPVAALELMDDVQLSVINQTGGAGGRQNWPERPTLFIKFSGNEAAVEDGTTQAKAISTSHGGADFEMATSHQAMEDLWSARKQSLWAMLAVRPQGTEIWSTDVAVPMSRIADIIEYSKQNASRLGLFSSVLGHVGDGNFHQAIMYHPHKTEEAAAVKRCVHDMVTRALEMDGTVSGEHGIGLGKKDCLVEELGPATVQVMRTLKQSLDPHWLLNPGKVFDS